MILCSHRRSKDDQKTIDYNFKIYVQIFIFGCVKQLEYGTFCLKPLIFNVVQNYWKMVLLD